MTNLEQKIFDKLVERLNIAPTDIEGVDENSPYIINLKDKNKLMLMYT